MADLFTTKAQQVRKATAAKQIAAENSDFHSLSPEEQNSLVDARIKKQDADSMDWLQFRNAYGTTPEQQRQAGDFWAENASQNAIAAGEAAGKSRTEDFLTGLQIGGTNVIGGLAGLVDAVTPGSNGVLADISGWANDTAGKLQNDYSLDAQSQRAKVQADIARKEAIYEDLRQKERAVGAPEHILPSPLGHGIIAGLDSAIDNPRAAMTYGAEAVPSVVEAVATGGAARKLAAKGLAMGLSEAAAAEGAAGATIFSGEAGGVIQGVRQEVLGMSDEDLAKVPGINELKAKYPDGKELRLQLADKIGTVPALTEGVLALLVSKGTGALGLEAGTKNAATKLMDIPKRGLTGMANETLEEVPQGYFGQVAQNAAMQEVDPTRDINKGAAEAVVQSIIGAMATGGPVGSMQATPSAIKETVKRGVDKVQTAMTAKNEKALQTVQSIIAPATTTPADSTATTATSDSSTAPVSDEQVQQTAQEAPTATPTDYDIEDIKRGAELLHRQFSKGDDEAAKQKALMDFFQLRKVLNADSADLLDQARSINVQSEEDQQLFDAKVARAEAIDATVERMNNIAKAYGGTLDDSAKADLNAMLKSGLQNMDETQRETFKQKVIQLASSDNTKAAQEVLAHISSLPEEDQRSLHKEVQILNAALNLKSVFTSLDMRDTQDGQTVGTEGFMGTEQYATKLRDALAVGKTKVANRLLDSMDNFVATRYKRLAAFEATYAKAKAQSEASGKGVKLVVPGEMQLGKQEASYITYRPGETNNKLLTAFRNEVDTLQKARNALYAYHEAMTGTSKPASTSTQATAQPASAPVETASKPTSDSVQATNTQERTTPKVTPQADTTSQEAVPADSKGNPVVEQTTETGTAVEDTPPWETGKSAEQAAETTPTQPKATTAARPPRVQLKTASWLNENAQADRDLADRLGVTGDIEALFAEGLTAKQVELELLKRGVLGSMAEEDRAGFVLNVRATLGIPSKISEEGKEEFAAWKADYDKRVQAATTQASQEDATTSEADSKPVTQPEAIADEKAQEQAVDDSEEAGQEVDQENTQKLAERFSGVDRAYVITHHGKDAIQAVQRSVAASTKESSTVKQLFNTWGRAKAEHEQASSKVARLQRTKAPESELLAAKEELANKSRAMDQIESDLFDNLIARYYKANKTAPIQTISKILDGSSVPDVDENLKPVLDDFIESVNALAETMGETLNSHEYLNVQRKEGVHPKTLATMRFTNPINHLREANGKIPTDVLQAMATVAHNYLFGRGQETLFNTDSDIAQITGNPEETITAGQRALLVGKGKLKTSIANRIGGEVLKTLGWRADHATIPLGAKNAIQLAIGNEILVSLFNAGRLEVNNINVDALEANADLEAIPATLTDEQLQGDAQAVTLIKVITGSEFEGDVENINNHAKLAKLFAISGFERLPVLGEGKHGSVDPSVNGLNLAPTSYVEAAKELAAVPHIWDQTFDRFLTGLGEHLKRALGYAKENPNDHFTRLASVQGKNMSVASAISRMDAEKQRLEEAGGLDTPLHYSYRFSAMLRMQIDSSGLNPHRDKLHRHIAPPKAVHTTFDPNKDAGTLKEKFFLAAIGQGMGFKSDQNSLAWIADKVAEWAMANGKVLAAADRILQGEANEADQQLVADAAIDLGEEAASLKAIMNLAQLTSASQTKQPFATSLTYEIDGLANGPSVSVAQYGLEFNSKGQLTHESVMKLAQAGFHLDDLLTNAEYRANGGKDIYETLMNVAEQMTLDYHPNQQAAEAVLIPILDPFNRKAAKRIVTKGNYAAGDTSLQRSFTEDVIVHFLQQASDMLRDKGTLSKEFRDTVNTIIRAGATTRAQIAKMRESRKKGVWINEPNGIPVTEAEIRKYMPRDAILVNANSVQDIAFSARAMNLIGLAVEQTIGARYSGAYEQVYRKQRQRMNTLVGMANTIAEAYNKNVFPGAVLYAQNEDAAIGKTNSLYGPSLKQVTTAWRNTIDTAPAYPFSESNGDALHGLTNVEFTSTLTGEGDIGQRLTIKSQTPVTGTGEHHGLNVVNVSTGGRLDYRAASSGPVFTIALNDAYTMVHSKTSRKGVMVFDAVYSGLDNLLDTVTELNTVCNDAIAANNAFEAVMNKFMSAPVQQMFKDNPVDAGRLANGLGLEEDASLEEINEAIRGMYKSMNAARQIFNDSPKAITQFVLPDVTIDTQGKPEVKPMILESNPVQAKWWDKVRSSGKAYRLGQFISVMQRDHRSNLAVMSLLESLSTYANKVPVRVMPSSAIAAQVGLPATSNGAVLNGVYDPKTNTILLADHLTAEQADEILRHESIHAAITNALASKEARESGLIAQLEKLYAEFEQNPEGAKLIAKMLATYPNMTQNQKLNEFAAWALTDAGWGKVISSMKVPSTDPNVVRYKKLMSRFLSKLGDLLTRVLGLKRPTRYTGLHALIGIVDTLASMNTQAPVTDSLQAHISDLSMQSVFEQLDKGQTSEEHQEYLTSWVRGLTGRLNGVKNAASVQLGDTAADVVNTLDQANEFSLSGVPALAVSEQERYAYQLTGLAIAEAMETDVAVRNAIRDLYVKTKAALSEKDFIPTTAHIQDADYNDKVQAALDTYDHLFVRNKADRSEVESRNYLPGEYTKTHSRYLRDFMALVLTNEQFRQIVDKVNVSPEKTKILQGNPLDMATNITGLAMKKLDTYLLDQTGSAKDRLSALGQNLVAADLTHKARLYSQITVNGGKAITKLNQLTKSGKESVAKAIEKTGLLKAPVATVAFGTQLLLGTLSEFHANKLITALNLARVDFEKGKMGLLGSIANEVQGLTADNARIIKLLTYNNKLNDEQSNQARVVMQKVVQGFFKKPLSVADEESLYKVFLKCDLSSLLSSGYSLNDIGKFLNDNEAINTELDAIHAGLGEFAGYYSRMAENLGYFMVTGNVPELGTVANTTYIARRMTPGYKQASEAEAAEVLPKIEAMVSLYALRYQSKDTKAQAYALFQQESVGRESSNGLRVFMDAHNQVKEHAKETLFDESEMLQIKGYTKDTYNPNKGLMVGTLADAPEMKANGYVPVKQLSDGLHLYATDHRFLPNFIQGAFSTTSMGTKGTDMRSIAEAKGVALTHADLAAMVQEKTDAIEIPNVRRKAGIRHDAVDTDTMMPVLNSQGEIVNYRAMMSEYMRDTLLDKYNNGTYVLGSIAAHAQSKLATQEINRTVVKELKAMWDEGQANGEQSKFIAVHGKAADPDIKEAFMLLPETTKQAIRETFGGVLMVRRDMLDTVMGYRARSIAMAWAKDGRANKAVSYIVPKVMDGLFGEKGKFYAIQFEQIIQELMKEARFTTVVKSGVVQASNLISNIWQLMLNLVDPVTAVRDVYRGMEAADRFVKNAARIRELTLMKSLDSLQGNQVKYRNEILELEEEQRANPIRELFEEGMLTTFVEELNMETAADLFSRKHKLIGKVETWKEKQHKGIQTGIDFITAARHTKYTQAMLKVTRYSDLGARFALYNKWKADGEMNREEMMRRLHAEFVDYSIPTHPTLQYMDSMGLLWFPKYYLRIQKIVYGLLHRNPVGVILNLLSDQVVNTDSPIDSFITHKLPWNKVTLFGPIQTAPTLLPALNAM